MQILLVSIMAIVVGAEKLKLFVWSRVLVGLFAWVFLTYVSMDVTWADGSNIECHLLGGVVITTTERDCKSKIGLVLPEQGSYELPSAQTKDVTPPSINIAPTIAVKTDSPTVQGRVSDKNQIVQVTVNGIAVVLKSGVFSFSRYVPTSGTTVTIEAIDEWGNRSP